MSFPDIMAVTAAGVVTTVIGHPLDTIKVHLQTKPSLKTTHEAARSLIAERALFRGLLPPLCNAIIMNTAMFSVFRGIKNFVGEDDTTKSTSTNENLAKALLAGSIAGFVTACISTPTDYVKIQSQLNNGISSWDVAASTTVRCLFRGHLANLGREGVFTMVYLGLYDHLRPQGFWQIAAASSFTGGLAWVASYPFDTIKTIVQSSSTKVTSGSNYKAAMSRVGSYSKYYRGCGASTGRAVMVTSLRMIVYEAVLSHFR